MRLRSLVLPVLVAAVVLVVALAAGKSLPATPKTSAASTVSAAKTVHIIIQNYKYSPVSVTVRVGTKIVVTNKDQTAHTLTAKSGAFDTGTIQPGKTMSFTVKKVGVYPYYCQFHAFMLGTLKVVAS
jgi:plastocyanin